LSRRPWSFVESQKAAGSFLTVRNITNKQLAYYFQASPQAGDILNSVRSLLAFSGALNPVIARQIYQNN